MENKWLDGIRKLNKTKCYFKIIADSESREADAFIKRFIVDERRCKNKCAGYLGYGACEYYTTQQEVNEGGLNKLVRRLE